MSSLYDQPVQSGPEPGTNMDSTYKLPAGITLQTGSFDGKRWFALNQAGQTIAVTYEELEGLISGLADVWKQHEPDELTPEQLRLFDPDSPPEAPSEHRLDTAQ